MPTEVIATPRAGQQIARLDRSHAKAFGEFLDDLAARGCNALGYRLSGPAPVDHMCVKHLRDSLRVVVAFEEPDRAWILLVGRHDDQDPVLSVYAELYRLLGSNRRTARGGISRHAATTPRTCRPSWALPSPSSPSVRQRYAGQGADRRRYGYATLPSSKGTDRSLRSSPPAAGSHRKVVKSSRIRVQQYHVLSQTSARLTPTSLPICTVVGA